MLDDFSVPTPPGAHVTCGILVVQYIGDDGALGYGVSMRGEESLTAFIGLLERVQFDLQMEQREREDA